MSVYEKVKSIITEVKPLMDIEECEDLIDGGYFDSLEIMTIIVKLGESFDIEIPVDEISPTNFNSIAAIAQMTERLINK